MAILGISDNHNSGVCLLKDEKIVFAINEESLTRDKLRGGFPYLSLKEALKCSEIYPQDIECIVIASYMTPSFALRLIEGYHNNLRNNELSFSYLLNLYIIYQVCAYKLKLPMLVEKILSREVIRRKLLKSGLRAKVILIDHHHAHAAAAYYTSGTSEKTLIFTADAMGDALSVTVNIGKGISLRRVFSQTGFSSISTYYSRLTEFLGFRPLRHEGKITGLAGYGKYNNEIMQLAKNNFHFIEKKKVFNFKNYIKKENTHKGIYAKLKEYPKEDVAYNFQKNLEDEIVKFAKFWIKKTNVQKINLSGGIFANVSLNKRISEIKIIDKLYIFPHMGDGGLSMGAALAFQKNRPRILENIYLGQQYSNEYIKDILKNYVTDITFSFIEEKTLCEKIAQFLFLDKTVAHFNGRMEYGPRALGNRSILYRADDITCKEWLNKKLKRSSFMPFAPICLREDFSEMFEADIGKIGYGLKFMNIAVNCKKKMLDTCPGTVHIDNTARPQIIDYERNPRIFTILSFYKKLKGVSVVINTSFNKHEEPIVCFPQDAIDSFLRCELDYLVLNNFLVCKK